MSPKSKLFALIFALVSILLVVTPSQANQLLVNPNFDNGINDWQDPHFGTGFTADSNIYKSAPYSASSVISDLTGDDYSELYQNTEVSVGQTIYATAYVKTNISPLSTSAKAGISIQFFNGGTPLGPAVKSEIGGQTDWRLLYVSATAPASTTNVKFTIYKFAANGDQQAVGGISYFDDCVVSTDYIAPPLKTSLYNPGFENGINDWTDLYGFSSTVSSSTAHSGSYSAKKSIGVLDPPQNYYSQIYQDIYYNANGDSYPTNTAVYAAMFGKTDIPPATLSNAGLQLEFIDASGAILPGTIKDQIGGQTDWRQLYLSGRTPANTKKVRLSGYIFALQTEASLGGSAYYDDTVFSLSYIAPPPAPANLINANFENGVNDWDVTGKPVAVSTDIKHGGSYAAKFIVDDVTTSDYYAEIFQKIPVSAGKNVTATIWAKTDINQAASASAALSLSFLDANGSTIGTVLKSSIGGQTDWRQLSAAGIAPAGTANLKFSAYLFAPKGDNSSLNGKAYFDDASLIIGSKELNKRFIDQR